MDTDLNTVREALAALCAQDAGYQVRELPLRRGEQEILVLGIRDTDEERNLGDYQNVTYFVLPEGARPVVVDPGLRMGEVVREALGIQDCDVIISHYHLDHWIGFEPYAGGALHASPTTRMVLSQLVGIERTGKSIFFEGRLTDHHRRPTPTRAVNDAERLLPITAPVTEVTAERPFERPDLGLSFFELPYGQTEGTLYGLLEHDEGKLLFAGDLFAPLGGRLRVEPHYAFKSPELVVDEVIVVLRALLGEPIDPAPEQTSVRHWLSCLASPTEIALGHGILTFAEQQADVTHLLRELEDFRRIEKEHII
jgi:glyoxylase-like metal-dependent hydrolase (beta-lactamase superfamily II)